MSKYVIGLENLNYPSFIQNNVLMLDFLNIR